MPSASSARAVRTAAKRATTKAIGEPEIREHYELKGGRPNPYLAKIRKGTIMRQLDDDLLEAFPDSAAVNAALRALLVLRGR